LDKEDQIEEANEATRTAVTARPRFHLSALTSTLHSHCHHFAITALQNPFLPFLAFSCNTCGQQSTQDQQAKKKTPRDFVCIT